jgi:hypothetical protein
LQRVFVSRLRLLLSRCLWVVGWGFALVPCLGVAQAQDAPKLIAPSPQAIHPWQVPAPQGAAEAYFVNLKNNDKIETPFVLKFGLSGGWGLAPITAPTSGKSGHHHLLVNRELPLDFKKPLPFNDQYIHFGKGQMETVLQLAPGNYTLRLLLADDKHLPHFVYSKPVSVTVVKKNAADPASLVKKGIQVLVAGDSVKPPFRVQFHASGLSVGHLAQKQKETGHFRLTVVPVAKGPDAVMEFVNGQTEVWLSPPAGEYLLKLDLLDNTNPAKSLAATATASIRVP